MWTICIRAYANQLKLMTQTVSSAVLTSKKSGMGDKRKCAEIERNHNQQQLFWWQFDHKIGDLKILASKSEISLAVRMAQYLWILFCQLMKKFTAIEKYSCGIAANPGY